MPPRNAACRNLFLGILIFKALTARRLYKSFDVKGLITPSNKNEICFKTTFSLNVSNVSTLMYHKQAFYTNM
jgi:hypothetical protein